MKNNWLTILGKDGGNFGHEALYSANGDAGILLLNEFNE
jgi:hypothetical protein